MDLDPNQGKEAERLHQGPPTSKGKKKLKKN
jgi:hypothetical protein